MSKARKALTWLVFAFAVVIPLALSSISPLLAWRDPIYILGGFAGVVALSLLFVQPFLIAGYLPGLAGLRARRAHRWIGGCLALAVMMHVVALWITSPPDMIDALTFTSPTQFSVWGVIAMWAIFVVALLGALRRRTGVSFRNWQIGHTGFAAVAAVGSVVHVMLIEGTMEQISKLLLCALVIAVTLNVLANLRDG